ncbi:MAG TPA: ABC transporter ATP-binding protein [Candidatus Brocadiia bacterium]|nr:ABC transporter ATP-binding protein [Candidatus Brocadiia bacterium]
MVSITLKNLTKRFGSVTAVDRLNVRIAAGELFFLLGPSGCGKTTVLRCIAGFNIPDEGEILFDDKPVARLAPQARNAAMVFQNYALWPHMTVGDNVAYGLEVRKVGKTELKYRVAKALQMVKMEKYAERFPNELSGGQQQRVAVARALVVEPDVVLLDEPLSNLDAKLRLEMRSEIRRIHETVGVTMVYVTHDQKEALSMADRLILMNDGRLEQEGAPWEVYNNPATPFAAEFIGETNFIKCRIRKISGGAMLQAAFGEIQAAGAGSASDGADVICSIRPEHVELVAPDGGDAPNTFAAKVLSVTYLGETEQALLDAGGERLKMLRLSPRGRPLHAGDEAKIRIAPESPVVFPK